MRREVRALTAFAVLSTCGCFPFYARERAPPDPPDRLTFVDSQTNEPVTRLLVIPKYSSACGWGTGAGHGAGDRVLEHHFLAHPFVYQSGEPMTVDHPRMAGIFFLPGAAAVFCGSSLDDIAFVAPGYAGFWLGDDRAWGPGRYALKRSTTAPTNVVELLAFLKTLPPPQPPQPSARPHPLELRFSAADERVVDTFLASRTAENMP